MKKEVIKETSFDKDIYKLDSVNNNTLYQDEDFMNVLKIVVQARFDSLTKVYNRYLFFEFVDKETAHSERTDMNTCFALLDIDNFKKVDDEHGRIQVDNGWKKY